MKIHYLARLAAVAGLALAFGTGAQAADKKTLVFVVNGASDFWKEAEAGVREIEHDYGRHARAARRLAEQHFDSDLVLRRFLADAGVAR